MIFFKQCDFNCVKTHTRDTLTTTYIKFSRRKYTKMLMWSLCCGIFFKKGNCFLYIFHKKMLIFFSSHTIFFSQKQRKKSLQMIYMQKSVVKWIWGDRNTFNLHFCSSWPILFAQKNKHMSILPKCKRKQECLKNL